MRFNIISNTEFLLSLILWLLCLFLTLLLFTCCIIIDLFVVSFSFPDSASMGGRAKGGGICGCSLLCHLTSFVSLLT